MQQKILEKNPYAIFIPCAGHSLNLVGSSGVDCCIESANFFSYLNKVFTFFSASTKRWSVLLKHSDRTLKKLSETRWNAHANSLKVVVSNYESIISALLEICEDNELIYNQETRLSAKCILDKMEEFEFVLLMVFRDKILGRINSVSQTLQNSKMTLDVCSSLYLSLHEYIQEMRQDFDKIEKEAQEFLPDIDYRKMRKRIRKKFPGFQTKPHTSESHLEPREKFKYDCFDKIIDVLSDNLQERGKIYQEVFQIFGFLTHTNLSEKSLRENVDFILTKYPKDIYECLYEELKHFFCYLKINYPTEINLEHKKILEIIITNKLGQVFPNMETILRIYMCMMVTNCSGERSFSKLKLTKTYLRSTISQSILNSLTVMSINSDKLRKLSYDDVIDDFSREKCRKKMF